MTLMLSKGRYRQITPWPRLLFAVKANELNITDVAKEKLAIINLALGVVLRRYNASRKQRRNELHGEQVPTENGE